MVKTIYFDCDGVLFDFVTPFLRWAEENNHVEGNGAFPLDKYSFMGYNFPGLEWHTPVAEAIRLFQQTPEFGTLPSTVLVTYLEMLKLSGYNLEIITAAGHTTLCMQRRMFNIASKYPGIFSRVHFTHGAPKTVLIHRKKLSGLLVEDNLQEALDVNRHQTCIGDVKACLINDIQLNPFLVEDNKYAAAQLDVFDSTEQLCQSLMMEALDWPTEV